MSQHAETVVRSVRGLGALVAENRGKQGLTQAELARRAGVTREWLVRFETGSSAVTLFRVMWVLRELDLELIVRETSGADDG